MSDYILYCITKCCCYSDAVSISMSNNDIEIQMLFNFDNEFDASIFHKELRKMTNSFSCQARITVEEITKLYKKVKKR